MNTKYSRLCARKLAGEITPAEARELEIWLAASENNRSMLEGMNRIWQNSEPPASVHFVDIDTEWTSLEKRLGLYDMPVEKGVEPVKTKRRRFSLTFPQFRPVYGVAMAALIVAAGLLIWRNWPDSTQQREIVTPYAQKTEILLSDGSKVIVNSGSNLKYMQPFDRRVREVQLEGEAFFDVKADGRPFYVLTSNARTSVLGTAFNIKCRYGRTSVSVISGVVKLETIGADREEVILTENQTSSVDGENGPSAPADTENGAGWLNGLLQFRMTPLIEICEELERTYDVSINIENDNLNDRTITADFPPLSIDKVLNSLCITLGASYTLENDAYSIR